MRADDVGFMEFAVFAYGPVALPVGLLLLGLALAAAVGGFSSQHSSFASQLAEPLIVLLLLWLAFRASHEVYRRATTSTGRFFAIWLGWQPALLFSAWLVSSLFGGASMAYVDTGDPMVIYRGLVGMLPCTLVGGQLWAVPWAYGAERSLWSRTTKRA